MESATPAPPWQHLRRKLLQNEKRIRDLRYEEKHCGGTADSVPILQNTHGNIVALYQAGATMEILKTEPRVGADRRVVSFVLSTRGRDLECAVTREALEQYFWLQPGASETRVLKTFQDGCRRIFAVAERKCLARPTETLLLTSADFLTRP